MGFASFWASITAPRVKEISPSSADFWPERGRPITSSAVRATRGDIDADRSTKRGRFARSFSRPRRAQRERERASSRPAERTQHLERTAIKDLPDVPSVPALPSLPLNLRSVELSLDNNEPQQPEDVDIGRPGTAITTEGLQELAIFELPAEPPTPEQTIETLEDPISRTRSKSAGPEETRPTLSKKPSWFRLGSFNNKDKTLPPPPPPNCPLPAIPPPPALRPSTSKPPRVTSVQSQNASVHDDDTSNPSRSSSSTTTAKSILEDNKNNDDDDEEDSILDSFPLPRLVHDIDETPDSSIADSSEAGSLHQSTSSPARESVTFRYHHHHHSQQHKKIPAPISTNPAGYGHRYKDSAIGTPKSPHTPTGIQRWTRQPSSSFEDETLGSPGLLDISLEDWAGEDGVKGHSRARSASNDQALASLEFGTLK